ncbi:uncharacterized protein si:dkeyp-69b9.6 [Erpetoichthys calabaricus]|uniref:uncharacterized protein si:dkeyp-69b9.6 n=1 Tax=Erpetoichthys calabaricus TaxID=27687 RepID=UPI002234911E|nr:uncharacterized protein si:dkeyp-69b9.6 [Erpetoichthys calabaricus]XP_051775772.1 uncharacterized protein si:dkeyp-69b9.6 [Erpetoichthys calabaricus]
MDNSGTRSSSTNSNGSGGTSSSGTAPSGNSNSSNTGTSAVGRGSAPAGPGPSATDWEMLQFGRYSMDILEMLSSHQHHQFKTAMGTLGLERQDTGGSGGGLVGLTGIGLGGPQAVRPGFTEQPPQTTVATTTSSSANFPKLQLQQQPTVTAAVPPPSSQQQQGSSGSRKPKLDSRYQHFLRTVTPFHSTDATASDHAVQHGQRFGSDPFGVSPGGPHPPPPLHSGLGVHQSASGPSAVAGAHQLAATGQNGSAGIEARSLHQQFSCMLAANQYFLSGMGVAPNTNLEQFLMAQQSSGLGLSQHSLHPSSQQPPAQQQHHAQNHQLESNLTNTSQQASLLQLPQHHQHHHGLHGAPHPSPQLITSTSAAATGFEFQSMQGIPVLSSNQLAATLAQDPTCHPGLLPPPLISALKEEPMGSVKTEGGGSALTSGSGGRRKKAMAGYLPQRKGEIAVPVSNSNTSSTAADSPQSLAQNSANTPSPSLSVSTTPTALTATKTTEEQQLTENAESCPETPEQEKERYYQCGECGKNFTHLSSLRRHLRSHGLVTASGSGNPSLTQSGGDTGGTLQEDSADKCHRCSDCGKGFKKRGHLLQHRVIHSGARPYACGVCQRAFNRRESLTRHEKIHEEKPYRCTACGRCFRESTSLLNHRASGTCGKPSRKSSSGRSLSNPQPLTLQQQMPQTVMPPLTIGSDGRYGRVGTEDFEVEKERDVREKEAERIFIVRGAVAAAAAAAGLAEAERMSLPSVVNATSSSNPQTTLDLYRSQDGTDSISNRLNSTTNDPNGDELKKAGALLEGSPDPTLHLRQQEDLVSKRGVGSSPTSLFQSRSVDSNSVFRTDYPQPRRSAFTYRDGIVGQELVSQARFHQTSAKTEDGEVEVSSQRQDEEGVKRLRDSAEECATDATTSVSRLQFFREGQGQQFLRKVPLAPNLHPHLPLSSLLEESEQEDDEDEVDGGASSAVTAAISLLPGVSVEDRGVGDDRRDIIGGLLGNLGLGLGGLGALGSLGLTGDKSFRGEDLRVKKKPRKREPGTGRRKSSEAGGGSTTAPANQRSNAGKAGTAEKLYLCSVCGRGFNRRETLRRHDRIHTGEKPHRCPVCGKYFREAFHLSKHRTVHTGEKNYKCPSCGKDFGYAQSLKRHSKLHQKAQAASGEFTATLNNNSSTVSAINSITGLSLGGSAGSGGAGNNAAYFPYGGGAASAVPHLQDLTKARLYTCSVCWKSFRHSFHLTAHQTVHTGERIFSCEVCGKTFGYSNSLTRHRLAQHGISKASANNSNNSGTSNSSSSSSVLNSTVSECQAATNALLQLAPSAVSSQPPPNASLFFLPATLADPGQQGATQSVTAESADASDLRTSLTLPLAYAVSQAAIQSQDIPPPVSNCLPGLSSSVPTRVKRHKRAKRQTWRRKRFPCTVCTVTSFRRLSGLIVHQYSRHKSLLLATRRRCMLCGQQFKRVLTLLAHRSRHLKMSAHVCHLCPRKFWNPRLLERHKSLCRSKRGLQGNRSKRSGAVTGRAKAKLRQETGKMGGYVT